MSCDDDSSQDGCANNFALVLITCGMILVLIGCLWPIEPAYVIDPRLSAVENEAKQHDYVSIQNALFTVSIVGMGCLLAGGLITAVLICRIMCLDGNVDDFPKARPSQSQTACRGASSSRPVQEDEDDKNHLVKNDKSQDYGSTDKG